MTKGNKMWQTLTKCKKLFQQMTIYQKGTPKFIIKWQTILVCQNNNNVVYQMAHQNYRPKGHTIWLSKGQTKTFHQKDKPKMEHKRSKSRDTYKGHTN